MDVSSALQKFSTSLSAQEHEDLRSELSAYLNHLLQNDFAALLQLLYRVDVSEEKLKATLQQNQHADAGDLLAELLIERQAQKERQKPGPLPPDTLPGAEVW